MIKTTFFVSCIAFSARAIELQTSSSALTEILATMKVDTDYKSCKVTSNRTKAAEANLEELKKVTSPTKFTDPAFPNTKLMLYWDGVDD